MLDITNLQLSDLDKTLYPLQDQHLSNLKNSWYRDPQNPDGSKGRLSRRRW